MTAGLTLTGLGIVLFLYAYCNYKKEQADLAEVKKQDLVSYYLDLAYNLLPYKFWSAILGIVLMVVGIVVVLVKLPLVF